MCGRFAQYSEPDTYADLFDLERVCAPRPRYNAAPTQEILAARPGADGTRELTPLRWGLIPSWSKGPDNRYSMINARAETVATKPAYRAAFRARRCIIPAEGFYEWQTTTDGKQPHLIRRRDGQPFAMAGLWERWQGPDTDAIESCTIIVTDANAAIAPIHDRMPVILTGNGLDAWLDPTIGNAAALTSLLRPAPAQDWTHYPVSKRVNSPRNDDPSLVDRLQITGKPHQQPN